MELEKKGRISSLRDNVLSCYRLYHQDNKKLRDLPNHETQPNKSNKFIKNILSDFSRLMGAGNHPKDDTLISFFYDENYYKRIRARTINKLEYYCKLVKRVDEIRKLKSKTIQKLLSTIDDPSAKLLANRPLLVSKLIEQISKRVTSDLPSGFAGDLKHLFVEKQMEHLVDESTIEVLASYTKSQSYTKKSWIKVSLISATLMLAAFLVLKFIVFPDDNVGVENISKSEVPSPECSFDVDNNTYRILIVPFQKMGGLSGETNVGQEIEKRLDRLNKADGLNIQVHYCKGFEYDKNAKDGDELAYYSRVMNKYNADHIIYGSKIEMGDVQVPDLTKLEVSYSIRPKQEFSKTLQYHPVENSDLVTLLDLSYGELLGDIEYIIYLNSAIAMYQKGNLDAALKYLDLIDDVGPGRFDYTRLLSLIYYQKGLVDNALYFANELINTPMEDEDLVIAYNNLGLIKTMLGDDSALEDYNYAISLDSQSPLAYLNIAKHLCVVDGAFQEANDYLEKSISLVDGVSSKLYLYGGKKVLTLRAKMYDEALDDIEKVIALTEEPSMMYIEKANILHQKGENLKAVELLEEIIKKESPSAGQAFGLLGHIQFKLGNKKEALVNFDRMLKNYPCHRESLLSLEQYFRDNNKYKEAEQVINNCLSLYPRNYELLNLKVPILRNLDRPDEANKVIKSMHQLSPTIYRYYDERNQYLRTKLLFDSLSGRPRTVYKIIEYDDGTFSNPIDINSTAKPNPVLD